MKFKKKSLRNQFQNTTNNKIGHFGAIRAIFLLENNACRPYLLILITQGKNKVIKTSCYQFSDGKSITHA